MTRSHEPRVGSTDEETHATGRRGFLRGAATAGTALVGFGAATGTAAAGGSDGSYEAPQDYPLVSTRDHYAINWYGSPYLTAGHTATDYDIVGNWDTYDDADEICVFVHGWNQDDSNDDDIDSSYTCELALDQNGYDAFNVGFSWDSDKGGGIDQGWYEAKEIARDNGPKLANWIANTGRPAGQADRPLARRSRRRQRPPNAPPVGLQRCGSLDDASGWGNRRRRRRDRRRVRHRYRGRDRPVRQLLQHRRSGSHLGILTGRVQQRRRSLRHSRRVRRPVQLPGPRRDRHRSRSRLVLRTG
ncbi:MAG: hypothetical protein ABEI77_01805 [Halorientalis sp.]